MLPSLKTSRIRSITIAETSREVAHAGESITLELEDDVDVSRGNMIVPVNSFYTQSTSCSATLNWMDEQPLTAGKSYLLHHGVNRVKAKVVSIQSVLDINTMEEKEDATSFRLNDIGRVALKTAKPLFADLYKDNPRNGAFILIDEFSNNTVAVGMIESF